MSLFVFLSVTSIYRDHHPDFVSYLYLVGPISLAILNPIGFVSMEVQRNRQATHQQSRLAMVSMTLCQLSKAVSALD